MPPRLALSVTPDIGRDTLCLFLHGIGGGRVNWLEQLRAVGGVMRAAALDLRGMGAVRWGGRLDRGRILRRYSKGGQSAGGAAAGAGRAVLWRVDCDQFRHAPFGHAGGAGAVGRLHRHVGGGAVGARGVSTEP